MRNSHTWLWFIPFALVQGVTSQGLIYFSGIHYPEGLSHSLSIAPLIILLLANRIIQTSARFLLLRYTLLSRVRTECQFLEALSHYSPGKLEDSEWQNKIHHLGSRVPSIPAEALQSGLGAMGHILSLFILFGALPSLTLKLLGCLIFLVLFEQIRIRAISRARLSFQKNQSEIQRKIGWFWDLFHHPDTAGEIHVSGKTTRLLHRYQELQQKEAGQFLVHHRKIMLLSNLYRAIGFGITTSLLLLVIGKNLEPLTDSMGMWVILVRCGQNLFSLSAAATVWMESYPVWREFMQFCESHRTHGDPGLDLLPTLDPVQFKATDVIYRYPGNKQFNLRFSGTAMKGDLIIIKGKNGSGKSTVLKLAAGILNPDQGSIERDNSKIGFVMQSKSLDDEIRTPSSLKLNQAEKETLHEKLFEILNLNDIPTPLADETLHGRSFSNESELSRGQWQRLSLYKAICNSDGLLLLDEPETSLDPVILIKLVEFLDLHRNSFYTLITSHHEHFDHSATQIWYLEEGTIRITQK